MKQVSRAIHDWEMISGDPSEPVPERKAAEHPDIQGKESSETDNINCDYP